MLADIDPTTLGNWFSCLILVVGGLASVAKVVQWIRGTPADAPTVETRVDRLETHVSDIKAAVARIDAHIHNGMTSDLKWLRERVDKNSEVLSEVQRSIGVLEGRERSQHTEKAR